MKNIDIGKDAVYKDWLLTLKSKINNAQQKAAISVNTELIRLYFYLGEQLYEKMKTAQWGDKVMEHLSQDLKTAFPEMKGFSVRNLKYCYKFYEFYTTSIGQQPVAQLQNKQNDESSIKGQEPVDQLPNETNTAHNEAIVFTQQLVAQIPWGHNILIFTKSKSIEIATFYIQQTITNGWSRDTLALQIKSQLHERQGTAISNFKDTLPATQSDLVQQTIKDPYVFDFLTLDAKTRELDIENQLVDNVSKFLLELGKGFAFIGRQYHLEVAQQDYYLDLLFYHVTLKCYVVIELKNTKFIPEYAGKLNFYLSAVDDTLKQESDQPSIGILLCRDKNNLEVEFSLRGMSQPIGVSEFNLTDVLPEELKSSLPTIEELENELEK